MKLSFNIDLDNYENMKCENCNLRFKEIHEMLMCNNINKYINLILYLLEQI